MRNPGSVLCLAALFACGPEGEKPAPRGGVVDVGYGTQQQSRITGAVVSVSADELDGFHFTRVEEMIAGRVPGADGERRSPYWLGPFHNYKTFCPYLVGSYERVADELADRILPLL